MNDDLAEVLLAKVMNWNGDHLAEERPLLQAMAACKYDEYQRFSPGRRFVESLALWLDQFQTLPERNTAYQFVKHRMIFISAVEMEHLVSVAYPDFIRHDVMKRAAHQLGFPEYEVSKICESPTFRALRRQCLFLGMADGAHTDIFRRSNSGEIGHEQVFQTIEITKGRAETMLKKLHRDLESILGREVSRAEAKFRMVFLLDDFSGSGKTYLRVNPETEKFEGKVIEFHDQLCDPATPIGSLVDFAQVEVGLVVYILTEQARVHLEDNMQKFWVGGASIPRVTAVHPLSEQCRLDKAPEDAGFLALCDTDAYYQGEKLEDSSTGVGGNKEVKRGFARCTLPLVLAHNSPNNSVALLWSYEEATFRGLFPRVPRHRHLA